MHLKILINETGGETAKEVHMSEVNPILGTVDFTAAMMSQTCDIIPLDLFVTWFEIVLGVLTISFLFATLITFLKAIVPSTLKDTHVSATKSTSDSSNLFCFSFMVSFQTETETGTVLYLGARTRTQTTIFHT